MTTENAAVIDNFEEAPRQIGGFRRFSRVFLGRKIVIFGMVVIGLLIITAIFAPLLAPYNPNTLHP